MEKCILKIRDLTKTYHTKKEEIKAVEKFNLDLMEGEGVAIVGPSGCGKSTILSILSGIDKEYGGKVIFDNIKFGYMFQQDALLDYKTILDNALLGLEIEGSLNKDTKEYVINLLKTYGLKDFINSYPSSLSGGMRQRVALIRTLATKPDIILLDEPFSALDYQTRLIISDDVYKILKNEGKSFIMVTHDIAEAISMADKVVILSSRPSKVKKIIDVDFKDKTTPINNRKCELFNAYYEAIWKEIDYNV